MNTVSAVGELIGNTPVFSLEHPLVPPNKKLFIKLEQFNPNFSIKDRTALGLIQKAFESGKLKPGGTVIESTSGNLGKSLAMLSASLGFHLIVVVDPKVSKNSLNWFKAFGAEVEVVEVPDAFGGYQTARIERVKELLKTYPGAYWTNQYDNPDNPLYHELVTAKEFLDLPVDMIVGSVSTGGHFGGISKGIRAARPEIRCMACDVVGSAIFGAPFHPYLLNGLGLSWRAENTDLEAFDFLNSVTDQNAISLCRLLARDTGLLLGGSSGVVIFSALMALQLDDIQSVMAIAPDSGINYLEQFYDDEWLADKKMPLLSCEQLRQQLALSLKAFDATLDVVK
ncbi:pyridoxal-phosphate dependent enzyme (plasmid) [Chimaeribacter arupi]|uniref:cysteine synthase n=1 Tax=Chimaeribacter arupi TaxID=2060066 RepID=A0A2N5ENA4_9GAMM|nr:pyridoxal-phosphate dependent enzyme [Chimaeribacter arupi]PLR50157.1 cysteine synthase [Chimaeribacter arupi]WKZ94920.1 pyridoxal-phosphate dependent enzyme [Chimaeribacter arupi]